MFLPTSSHFDPLYLNTNKSPLEAVVVNVGAVSSLNSYSAFQDNVLEQVPSCITSNEKNCPVTPPEALHNVVFAPNVTFATGLVLATQEIVEASDKVSSERVAPPEKVAAPVTPKVVLTVAAPVTAKVDPSKVKFASP